MRSLSSMLALVGAIFLTGCATNKALLHLPVEQRGQLRFAPCTNCFPDIRFENLGAAAARKHSVYGGALGAIIGHSVAHSIEKNNETVRKIRDRAGDFEWRAMNDGFQTVLRRNGFTNAVPIRDESTLHCRLRIAGLQEMERKLFAAFGVAEAQLRSAQGKTIWEASAESALPELRPLEDFEKDPSLYRRHFEQVAEDLARQLIEGPIRIMTR